MTDKLDQIPLEKIDVDFSWNGRYTIGDDVDGPEEHTFSDLVSSLLRKGQDTPVTIRPKGDRYELGAGFRRYRAFQKIQEQKKQVPGVKRGHIKALIRDLTDVDMLSLNGRENIARNSLNMADKAFLIHRLHEKTGMTTAQMAEELGLSTPYVWQLKTVYDKTSILHYTDKNGVEKSVFDHWREAPGRVPFATMLELSRSGTNDRLKELKYVELLTYQEPETSEDQKKEPKKNGRVKNDVVTAENLGRLLGALEREGFIELKKEDWRSLLEHSRKITFSRGAPSEYVERVTESAKRAYWRAIEQQR